MGNKGIQNKTGTYYYTDHLNNKFSTLEEMCHQYNISRSTYTMRLKSGWTQEEALVTPISTIYNGKQSKDHLGNEFSSIEEMCKYWNINRQTYDRRIRAGYSLSEALTIPVIKKVKHKYYKKKHDKFKGINIGTGKIVKDHLGNTFNTVGEMCKAHGVSTYTFYHRREAGKSLSEQLTPGRLILGYKGVTSYDHLGNKFRSISAMCREYNIERVVYLARIRNGWDKERALLTPVKHQSNSSQAQIKHYLNKY